MARWTETWGERDEVVERAAIDLPHIEELDWSAPQRIASGDLSNQYYNVRDPGRAYTAAEFIAQIKATPAELAAIEAGVAGVLAWEKSLTERIVDCDPLQRTSFDPEITAESAMLKLEIPWQRRITLMVAVLRIAKERGVSFRYQNSLPLHRRPQRRKKVPA